MIGGNGQGILVSFHFSSHCFSFFSFFFSFLLSGLRVTKLKVHVNYFPTQRQQQRQQSPAFIVDQFQLIRALVFECVTLYNNALPSPLSPCLSPSPSAHASLPLGVSISSNSSPFLVCLLTFLSASSTRCMQTMKSLFLISPSPPFIVASMFYGAANGYSLHSRRHSPGDSSITLHLPLTFGWEILGKLSLDLKGIDIVWNV